MKRHKNVSKQPSQLLEHPAVDVPEDEMIVRAGSDDIGLTGLRPAGLVVRDTIP